MSVSSKGLTAGMSVDISGLCPFCGGEWAAGRELRDDVPAVVHTLPSCSDFKRDEPDEFLRRVRTAMSKAARA